MEVKVLEKVEKQQWQQAQVMYGVQLAWIDYIASLDVYFALELVSASAAIWE